MNERSANYCVILAGGTGRRLWPCSSKDKPKQFLDFFGVGRTLLQQTYDRFIKILPHENIYVSTFVGYVDLVKEQLPGVDDEHILAEPVQLSTAPAVAWATYHIASLNPNANMIITPVDQMIINERCFLDEIIQGLDFVQRTPNFLTLAVKPTVPEKEYGYIQIGEEVSGGYGRVKSFTEKPDLEFARMFVSSGEFFWNTGVFLWNVQTMLKSLADFIPNIAEKLENAERVERHEEEQLFVREYYPSSMYLSIDLVILERNENVFLKCGNFGWADIGSWTSLYEVLPKDEDNNVVGNSQVIMRDCKNNIVNVPEGKVVVLQGLEGYVLAEKGNVLVVCKNDDPSLARRLVNEVQIKFGEEFA